MATYKGIRGVTIPTVDGDPGTIQLGEIWYNSSTKALRVGKTQAAAWASGGNLNTARYGALSGGGTQTSGMCAGGYGPSKTDISEEYDGTSWAEGNNLNTSRLYINGCGAANTAVLGFGGCLLYTSPSPRDGLLSRMPSSA